MTKNVVLLIGGDLCRHVAAQLDPAHWEIWGLRRNPPADASMRWIQADLADPASLRDLPQAISHVAYAPSPDAREPTSYQTTYPLGVTHLLDALVPTNRIKRFVLVGSTVVWPPTDAADAMTWVDESTPAHADNFRSRAILQAEATLHERLPGCGVALRLGGIYGAGRTRLIERLRSGQLMSPDGPGHWSNRIHIEDAASACIHLLGLSDPADCYIGTDGHPTDTREFHRDLADLLEVPHPASRCLPPTGKRLSNARLVGSGWTPRWPDALAGYRAMLAAG
ncbi:MAG TPA: NAD-dependent epimerase/dehydratase family protein [Oleiagrimonas sp.]|nr:NAD-dependent epimerase/dehydratase family protein [Oleiagrimonas sp.]